MEQVFALVVKKLVKMPIALVRMSGFDSQFSFQLPASTDPEKQKISQVIGFLLQLWGPSLSSQLMDVTSWLWNISAESNSSETADGSMYLSFSLTLYPPSLASALLNKYMNRKYSYISKTMNA